MFYERVCLLKKVHWLRTWLVIFSKQCRATPPCTLGFGTQLKIVIGIRSTIRYGGPNGKGEGIKKKNYENCVKC